MQLQGSVRFRVSSIQTNKSTYNLNEGIQVNFSNFPANSKNWIGLYRVGSSNEKYISYRYTPATTNGSVTLQGLPAGDYEARYFYNDTMQLQGSVRFRVSSS
jgi:hypothetical protein